MSALPSPFPGAAFRQWVSDLDDACLTTLGLSIHDIAALPLFDGFLAGQTPQEFLAEHLPHLQRCGRVGPGVVSQPSCSEGFLMDATWSWPYAPKDHEAQRHPPKTFQLRLRCRIPSSAVSRALPVRTPNSARELWQ